MICNKAAKPDFLDFHLISRGRRGCPHGWPSQCLLNLPKYVLFQCSQTRMSKLLPQLLLPNLDTQMIRLIRLIPHLRLSDIVPRSPRLDPRHSVNPCETLRPNLSCPGFVHMVDPECFTTSEKVRDIVFQVGVVGNFLNHPGECDV